MIRAPLAMVQQPNLARWIEFHGDHSVVVRSGKVEIGQGILTALRQIVAHELGVPPDAIFMPAASTAFGPDEGYTVGSLSIEQGGPTLRYLGALMRERLLAAVACKRNVDAARLTVREGCVLCDGVPTGDSYWSLAQHILISEVDPDVEVPLLPADGLGYLGIGLPRMDLPGKLAGGAFIQDLELPGMRHARVLRLPNAGARLIDIDVHRLGARHPGVHWLRRGDLLACVADSPMALERALATAHAAASWSEPVAQPPLQADLAPWLKALPVVSQEVVAARGEVSADGTRTFTGQWTRPFIAHASVGLSTGLAWQRGETLDVWTHSQGIFCLREQIARVLERELASVQVHHVAGAGCYGHNGADDAASEAAWIATELPGCPVRVEWTREDELSWAPFGAAGAAELQVQTSDAGRIVAWDTHITGTSHGARPGMHGEHNLAIAPLLDPRWQDGLIADTPQSNGGGASRNARPIYDVGAFSLALTLVKPPVRSSALRSLGAHLNIVAIEGMMDRIADDMGTNPLALRRRHLSDPRALRVLERVCQMSAWNGEDGNDTYWGFGLGRYKGRGAYCATVVEIALETSVNVRRVWCAVDAGRLINPDGALNQIEGGILQSLSWTLHEQVPFNGLRPTLRDWSEYPVLRFDEVPDLHVDLLPSDEPSVGIGEAAQGPMAGAIANAVSRAIGQRAADMPFDRERLMRLLA